MGPNSNPLMASAEDFAERVRRVCAPDKAFPAAGGAPVPDLDLPGGWGTDVVPVEPAAGLHPGHLGLWNPPRLRLCLPQPLRADWRLHPGAEQKFCPARLLRTLWDHCLADSGLQHLVGPEVPDAEPGTGGRPAAAAGGVPLGGPEHVCGGAHPAGEQPPAVHAAGRPPPPCPHVHDPASLRHRALLHAAGRGGLGADGAGGAGLEDEAGGADTDTVAAGHQPLPERLLGGPGLQAHARLPQVRLLPEPLRGRGPPPGGGPGARGGLPGREEEERLVGGGGGGTLLATATKETGTPASLSRQGTAAIPFCDSLCWERRTDRQKWTHGLLIS